MQNTAKFCQLLAVLIFAAFLASLNPVLAEEVAKPPIFGEMEFIPAEGNKLGGVILLKVRVSYDRSLLEFDQKQIPQKLSPTLSRFFRVRGFRHISKEEGVYTAEMWEFNVQFLEAVPPLKLEVPSLKLGYKEKGARHVSSFEIPGAWVLFEAITSENQSPDPVIKSLNFGPDSNLKAVFLIGLSSLFILAGVALVVLFFLRRQKGKIQESPPIDEFMARYNSLRESFDRGEDGLIVLSKLYLLLRSFYGERRDSKMKMGWQNDLLGEEKAVIEDFQNLYQENAVPKSHVRQLFERAKSILENSRGG